MTTFDLDAFNERHYGKKYVKKQQREEVERFEHILAIFNEAQSKGVNMQKGIDEVTILLNDAKSKLTQ